MFLAIKDLSSIMRAFFPCILSHSTGQIVQPLPIVLVFLIFMDQPAFALCRIVSYLTFVVATSAEYVPALAMGIAVHYGALVVASVFEEDLAETVGLVVFPGTSVYLSCGLSYVALSLLPALYQFLAASDVVRGQLMHFLADIGGNFGLLFGFPILIQRPGRAYGPP